MKRLFTGAALEVEAAASLLRQEGIVARILNQAVAGALGDIPAQHTLPQLWIERDEDEPTARAVVERLLAEQQGAARARPAWRCPVCGELIEGQFTECWNCTIDHEAPLDPDAKCDECGYPLRGLPDRRCPECGADF
jgi:rubrerythrin